MSEPQGERTGRDVSGANGPRGTPDLIRAGAVEVVPSGPVEAALDAPTSKSVTNRLLVTAALATGESRLAYPLDSDDSAAMRRIIAGLGVEVADEGDVWRVTGSGGLLRVTGGPLDAGLSGTALRFGTAVAALAPTPAAVTGLPPLLRRPVGPLVAALRDLGARVADDGGYPPVLLDGGGLIGGETVVDATTSSQYVSALLLAAPYAQRDVIVRVVGEVAMSYVELTVETMRSWGADVEQLGRSAWRVTAGRGYRARDATVEYDASAAGHLFALAVATAGRVTVRNAWSATLQPDVALLAVLEDMGAVVTRDGQAVTVVGPEQPAPVDVDLRSLPDQVTTVAALAALATGTSRITGVGVVRGHETDRLSALAGELGKLGVAVDEQPDGLAVHGGTALGPARLATHDDHRLAMAFASIGARVPGIVIEEPRCVTKTYPAFWDDLRSAGVVWRPVGQAER